MGLETFFRSDDLTVRALSSDADLKQVTELIRSSFSDAEERMGHAYTDLDELKGRLAKNFEIYGLYDVDDDLIATVHVSQKHRDDPKVMYFGRLAVAKSNRGQGVAKSIVESIIRYAKATGKDAIGMNYFSASPHLKAYYSKFGFEPDGEPFFWESEELNPLLLRL